MEYKLFSLDKAQKKGASSGHTIDYLIGGLIAVVLTATLSGTIFSYLGTGAVGLANATTNPGVPTWLPTILVIIVAVGIVYLILRAMNVTK